MTAGAAGCIPGPPHGSHVDQAGDIGEAVDVVIDSVEEDPEASQPGALAVLLKNRVRAQALLPVNASGLDWQVLHMEQVGCLADGKGLDYGLTTSLPFRSSDRKMTCRPEEIPP